MGTRFCDFVLSARFKLVFLSCYKHISPLIPSDVITFDRSTSVSVAVVVIDGVAVVTFDAEQFTIFGELGNCVGPMLDEQTAVD